MTTGYSAKALPEELLDALVAAKVRRVFIAYDRDKAGDEGAAAVAAQLAAYGVECLPRPVPAGPRCEQLRPGRDAAREIPRRACCARRCPSANCVQSRGRLRRRARARAFFFSC